MQSDVYKEMASVQNHHWWFTARREIINHLLHELKLPANAQLLELGCGTGGNLLMLSKHGELHAVESDSFAQKFAADLQICPVTQGSLPNNLPQLDQKYDLICLLDVLEHIEDDEGSLSQVEGLLQPDGRIVLTVPAYQWLWSSHDALHHHKRRYTAEKIKILLGRASLEAQRIGYFNTFLFPIVVLVRAINRIRKSDDKSGAAIPHRLLNKLFHFIFLSEKTVLTHSFFPFGTSVICIAKRK